MSGKARIGSTVIVSSGSKSDRRRLAHRLGRPLTSAAARAALGRLAVPAHGEVRGHVGLDPVEGVEDDHPLLDRDVVVDELAVRVGRPAKDAQVGLWHRAHSVGDELAKVVRQGRQRRGRHLHRLAVAADDAVQRWPTSRRRSGIVDPAVGAAALRALVRAAGDGLGHDQHVAQLVDEAPAGVVARGRPSPGSRPAGVQVRRAGRSPRRRSASVAEDPDERLHRRAELLVQPVGILAVGPRSNGAASSVGGRPDLDRVDVRARRPASPRRPPRRPRSRWPKTSRSDSELPPSRFAPCSPAATSPAAYRPGPGRRARLGVDPDPAHHVVRRRPDLHRTGRDVDVGQLLELLVHRRQLAADVVRPAGS